MTSDLPAWTEFDPGAAPSLAPSAGSTGRVVAVVAAPEAMQDGRAAAVALDLARGWGRRFVVADAGLEQPSLHLAADVPLEDGLSDLLLWGASIQHVARPVPGGGFVVTAGTAVGDGASTLAEPRWRTLCSGFREAGATFTVLVPSSGSGLTAVLDEADDVVVVAAAGEDVAGLLPGGGGKVRAVVGPGAVAASGVGEGGAPEAPAAPGPYELGDAAPEPEPSEPEPFEPELSEPEPLEPEPSEPESFEPEPFAPELFEPEPSEAEPLEPEPFEAEPLDPDAPEHEADHPYVAEVQAGEPEADEPSAAEPEHEPSWTLEPETEDGEASAWPADAATWAPAAAAEEVGDEQEGGTREPEAPEPTAPAMPIDEQGASDRELAGDGAPVRDEPDAAEPHTDPLDRIPPTPSFAEVVEDTEPDAPRPGRRVVVLLVLLLFVVAGTAVAGWLGYVEVPGITPRIGDPPTVPSAAPVAFEPPAEDAPVQTFSVALGAYQDEKVATDTVAALSASVPDVLFLSVPVSVSGRVVHRVLAGPAVDSAAAAEVAARVSTAAGIDPSGWVARNTSRAFQLGEMPELEAARRRVEVLTGLGIPAYILAVDYDDGSVRYRVYAGAYADEAEASYLSGLLQERGLSSATLSDRTGRLPE